MVRSRWLHEPSPQHERCPVTTVDYTMGGGSRVEGWFTGQTASQHYGSSSLLVIWGQRSNMATSEARVVTSKLLVNQWRSEPSSRGPLSHELAFTKSDDDPTLFTSVGSEADRV